MKESLELLIVKCRSINPSDRPIFDEIFNFLSYDIEFYLDGVDYTNINIKNFVKS